MQITDFSGLIVLVGVLEVDEMHGDVTDSVKIWMGLVLEVRLRISKQPFGNWRMLRQLATTAVMTEGTRPAERIFRNLWVENSYVFRYDLRWKTVFHYLKGLDFNFMADNNDCDF